MDTIENLQQRIQELEQENLELKKTIRDLRNKLGAANSRACRIRDSYYDDVTPDPDNYR
jgi:cell division protein FtsB